MPYLLCADLVGSVTTSCHSHRLVCSRHFLVHWFRSEHSSCAGAWVGHGFDPRRCVTAHGVAAVDRPSRADGGFSAWRTQGRRTHRATTVRPIPSRCGIRRTGRRTRRRQGGSRSVRRKALSRTRRSGGRRVLRILLRVRQRGRRRVVERRFSHSSAGDAASGARLADVLPAGTQCRGPRRRSHRSNSRAAPRRKRILHLAAVRVRLPLAGFASTPAARRPGRFTHTARRDVVPEGAASGGGNTARPFACSSTLRRAAARGRRLRSTFAHEPADSARPRMSPS